MVMKIDLSTYFTHQVISAAQTGCSTAQQDDLLTAKKLCCASSWDNLSNSEQIEAGHIVSAAVDADMLPLHKCKRGRNNHERYVLK
jgi:hypothetical protein